MEEFKIPWVNCEIFGNPGEVSRAVIELIVKASAIQIFVVLSGAGGNDSLGLYFGRKGEGGSRRRQNWQRDLQQFLDELDSFER